MSVKLSEPQRYAARMTATGIPEKAIAERLGIKPVTLTAWGKMPAFVAVREGFTEKIEDALESDLIGATSEMLDLWRRWMRGEVQANDPRIAVIAPTLLRWTETIFGIATPAGSGTKGQAGPSIQILNAPGAAAPRLRTIGDDDPDAILDELRSLPPPRENRKRRQAASGADPL